MAGENKSGMKPGVKTKKAGKRPVSRPKSAVLAQKKMSKSLQNTSPVIGSIILYSPLAVICTDVNGNVLLWNPAAEKIFGWSAKETIGKPNPIIPKDKTGEYLKLREGGRRGEPYASKELERQRKDGTRVIINASSAPLYAADGSVIALLGMFEDITERKLAEEKTRESEEQFAKVFRQAPLLITLSDIETGRLIDVNERFLEISGFARDEAVGKSVLELGWISKQQRSRMTKVLREKGRVSDMELILRCKDGRTVVCLYSGETIAVNGRQRLLSMAQDITLRKQAEEKLQESETRLNTILDNVGAAIFIKDAQYRYTYVNQKVCDIFGKTSGEILGKGDETFFSDESVQEIMRSDRPVIERGKTVAREEVALTSADGMPHTYWAVKLPLLDSAGKVTGLCGISTDITERKKAEEALRRREQQLAESQRIAHIGSWEHNLETNDVFWSDELFRLLGFDPAKDPGDFGKFFSSIHPDDQPALKKAIDETVRTGKHFSIDYRYFLPDGRMRILHAQAELRQDEAGKPVVLSGTCQDITERKQREVKLDQDRKLLELIAKTQLNFIRDRSASDVFGRMLNDLLTLMESEYGFIGEVLYTEAGQPYLKTHSITNIAWNDEMKKFYADHEKTGFEFFNLETLFGVVMKTGKPMISNDPYNDQRRGGLPEGHPALKAFLGIPFTIDGRLVGMAGISNRPGGYDEEIVEYLGPFATVCANIIEAYCLERERAESEEKYRLSEQFIRNILDTVDEGFIVIGKDYRIITANKAYCGQAGLPCEDVIGRHCYEISHGAARPCYELGEECAVLRVFETGESHAVLHRHTDAEGQMIYVETKGFPIKDSSGNVTSVIETINNITERHLLEQERLKTQKLESIGTLAGGIAHDFNNLLQGVFGYISMAKLSAKDWEKCTASLAEAEKALHLTVKLTNQLLTFSRGGRPVKKTTDLRPVIGSAVRFALSGSRSYYSFEADDDLWYAEVDDGQISQVVQNIVLNADQSMPMGGNVCIEARNVVSTGNDVPPRLASGKYVKIIISDTGIGIPEQYLDKIFDPYFTTKEKGSGLGLATAYSIIRNHDGLIDIISEPGRGTTFLIYLPATESSPPEPAQGSVSVGGKQGRVLVMDDEEVVLRVSEQLLRTLGHEVVCTENGEAAIMAYQAALASGHPFDIVILDLTIRGGMGGLETLKRLLEINPDVKAVVSSGYSDDETCAEFLESGFRSYLKKPYDIEELQDALNSLLA